MTTDVQVSVSEDLNHNTFILTSLPTYTLGCLACFLGEANPQDSRNINCSGHMFYVRFQEIALSSGQNLELP